MGSRLPTGRRVSTMPRDQLELYCLIGLWASLLEGVVLAAIAIALTAGWLA